MNFFSFNINLFSFSQLTSSNKNLVSKFSAITAILLPNAASDKVNLKLSENYLKKYSNAIINCLFLLTFQLIPPRNVCKSTMLNVYQMDF